MSLTGPCLDGRSQGLELRSGRVDRQVVLAFARGAVPGHGLGLATRQMLSTCRNRPIGTRTPSAANRACSGPFMPIRQEMVWNVSG